MDIALVPENGFFAITFLNLTPKFSVKLKKPVIH